jgi:hypothetical protein
MPFGGLVNEDVSLSFGGRSEEELFLVIEGPGSE